MVSRFKALIALGIVMFGLSVLPSTPAEAATNHGCPDDYACLYQSTWYSYGRWQASFYAISIANDGKLGCKNITGQFINGTPAAYANNNTASAIVNGAGDYGDFVTIVFHDGPNCNDDINKYAGANSFPGWGFSAVGELMNYSMNVPFNAYHRYSSVSILGGV